MHIKRYLVIACVCFQCSWSLLRVDDDALGPVERKIALNHILEAALTIFDLIPHDTQLTRNHRLDRNGTVHPIILVAPWAGSELVANISMRTSSYWYCSKHGTDVPLWFHLSTLMPFRVNCWMERMNMSWNQERLQYDANGVRIGLQRYGEMNGFNLAGDVLWNNIYNALQPLGYGQKSIRGAQYDFRLGPKEWKSTGLFDKFKLLIEQTSRENGGRRVIPLTHSAGGWFVRQFLASGVVDSAWKDRFIESWISLATPFRGITRGFHYLFHGSGPQDWVLTRVPWLDQERFRDTLLTWPAFYMSLAQPSMNLTTPFVISTPSRNYTIEEMPLAIADARLPQQIASLYEHRGPGSGIGEDELEPPGVDVHCWYALGVPETIETVTFGEGFQNEPTNVTYTDGDGMTPKSSLRACAGWPSRDPAHTVSEKVFPRISHMRLITSPEVISSLTGLIAGKNKRLLLREASGSQVGHHHQ